MDFKYFDDYEKLAALTEKPVRCAVCYESRICFEAAFMGVDELENICPECVHDKKLYDRDIFANEADVETLRRQVKEVFPQVTSEEQELMMLEKTNEVEKATPQLITWQDMEWPCLDGDYAKFIGYGSKPMFNEIAGNNEGQKLFKQSLHDDLKGYYETDQWEDDVPDKLIPGYKESKGNSMLFYVFKSLHSDRIIIWWDTE